MVRILQFDWQEEYNFCRKNVRFAKGRFDELGIPTLINPASLIICIPNLPEWIVKKYFIACHADAHLGEMCHIILCPHVTEDILELFFSDVKSSIDTIPKEFMPI